MSLQILPAEILVLITSELDIEDQFSLSLTCKLLHSIAYSDFLCRVQHRFSPDYESAFATGNYSGAWRRLVKKRIAVKTATPYQACVLGFGERFVFSNGALMYKPTINEIRILFLDGSASEELRVDITGILEEARRLFGNDLEHDSAVEPLNYAHGIATFVIEDGIEYTSRAHRILIANIHRKTVLNTRSLEIRNCIFVRNTERFLWLGERTAIVSETPRWQLRMLDLKTGVWGEPRVLPVGFSGRLLGQAVCFEIISDFIYGVQSSVDEMTGHTIHYVFRLSANGGPEFDYGYFNVDRKTSHYDNRYNELKLVKDAGTGVVQVYEVRKEFLSMGYSERICHSYCVNFTESPISQKSASDVLLEPFELIGARESQIFHRGDSGLNIQESDPRRLVAHSYDVSTRTFLDIVKETSPGNQRGTIAYFSSRKYDNDSICAWPLNGHSLEPNIPACSWPPRYIEGTQQRTQQRWLQTFMNPTGIIIDEARWSYWNGLLLFSPVSRESVEPRPIILLSFDPGLYIPGLEGDNSGTSRSALEKLMQMPDQPAASDSRWIVKVKPFHLVIKSLEEKYCRCYGANFGYNRPK